MDVAALLDRLREMPSYAGQLQHVAELPAREGIFAEPQRPLPPELARLLAARGIRQLYAHQAAALDAAGRGEDLVVVTGTASGKTLCYNLPILSTVLAEPEACALYLYPTKALAQDQLKGLWELLDPAGEAAGAERPLFDEAPPASGATQRSLARHAPANRILAGVYDGDTPTAQRRRIKAEAQLVLSNPDMLHASVLPYHPQWARLFENLRYVVIDEIHSYRGILGANVAAVLRRLWRVCEHYGSRPVVLAASATIANPGELASKLIGRDVTLIDNDGSPRGRKLFALWNPAPLGNDRLARTSATDDAVLIMGEALMAGGQVLAFARTRQAAELIHRYVQDDLVARRSPLAERVRAYRGGYLPLERRAVEADLAAGRLRGVAATNALELGIDIGTLDVTLLAGYPGTIASTWQQAGRSGRRQDESLSVLLAGNDPVDQYLCRHPDYFFAQSPEHAVVDPGNPYVLASHLQAAAFELPLDEADLARFGALAPPIAAALCESGMLAAASGQYFFAAETNPAARINLRHMSDNTFSIVLVDDSGNGRPIKYSAPRASAARPAKPAPHPSRPQQVIANVDAISAPELVYPQAVYLHNAETYLVRELDLEGKVAYVERRETDYYTQAVLESNVRIAAERAASQALPARLAWGDVHVTWQTVAFKKIKFGTRENIGLGPVDIPAQSLPSTGLWLSPSDALRQAMRAARLRPSEGVVGLRNLAIVALPMVAMCDPRDIGGVVDSQNLGASTLILYDRYPGGLGYCEKGFHRIAELLAMCWEMVRDCPCDDGCPSCVGLANLRPAIHSDPDLTRGYPLPNKQATLRLLELLCGLAEPGDDGSDARADGAGREEDERASSSGAIRIV